MNNFKIEKIILGVSTDADVSVSELRVIKKIFEPYYSGNVDNREIRLSNDYLPLFINIFGVAVESFSLLLSIYLAFIKPIFDNNEINRKKHVTFHTRINSQITEINFREDGVTIQQEQKFTQLSIEEFVEKAKKN
jgi:hypothetical protein